MRKTNVMRMLEDAGIPYQASSYEVQDGRLDGMSVAEKTGLLPEEVFKTLVCRSGNAVYVFIVPVSSELDLKKAAAAAGVKKMEMLKQKDLKRKTSYVHGGCSPIGMKRLYPSFLDESARGKQAISVSAGKIGTQVRLAPDDLLRMIEGEYADLRQS